MAFFSPKPNRRRSFTTSLKDFFPEASSCRRCWAISGSRVSVVLTLDIKHHVNLMSRHHLEGFALFPPSVEAPLVGKIAALLGFDRLDGAGVGALEEDARAVRFGFEHET